MSKASDLAIALTTKLETILIANGFETDIGARVFRGKASINIEHLPCIVLVEEHDNVIEVKQTQAVVEQHYVIEGHAECDPDYPNDTAHLILADLKRAVFSGDRTFGNAVKPSGLKYVTRAIGIREDGSKICAASIEISMLFVEDMLNP